VSRRTHRPSPLQAVRASCRNAGTTLAAASALGSASLIRLAQAQQPAAPTAGRRPNILVIFGDDIGYWNISAYSRGLMDYRTPNIDRITKEGAIFTDLYAQQSCTVDRAAFITGQTCFRSSLSRSDRPCDVKIPLANPEPSAHGTSQSLRGNAAFRSL
jgi:hypothetical protein